MNADRRTITLAMLAACVQASPAVLASMPRELRIGSGKSVVTLGVVADHSPFVSAIEELRTSLEREAVYERCDLVELRALTRGIMEGEGLCVPGEMNSDRRDRLCFEIQPGPVIARALEHVRSITQELAAA